MTGGREPARRPPRAPLRRRSRQRWAVAGGVAACWLVLEVVTGSAVSATVVLMVIAALTAAVVGGLRTLGITRDHPWLRRMASRPWRDGQDVLEVAMRHLADVFLVTPSGALLAPNLVELQLNPDDLDFSLRADGTRRDQREHDRGLRRAGNRVRGPPGRARAGPRCTSSRPDPSRRAATACGREIP